MTTALRINPHDLLHQRSVESTRVEFKATFNEHNGPQVLATICTFANDYQNLGGGYVVIGVAEQNGRAVLPAAGITVETAERAQNWLRGRCKAMQPSYQPVFAPEWIDDRLVLVVWAQTSPARPHRAPDQNGQWKYWIRVGSATVDAETRGQLELLLEQTARVPWDDRPAADARIADLREAKAREFLRDIDSGLLELADATDIYRRMHITTRANDHEVPRNVGLLLFSEDPEAWFRGARIDVVRFAADRAGDVLDERVFRGTLSDQLRDCLRYLEGLSLAHLRKERDRSQVRGWVSYPHVALREALVNALYHRAYRADVVEPTKVYLYPNRIEVISYPGPVAGIERRHLDSNEVPPVPARNGRIGEFLKELKLAEGRLTGLPKIYDAMAKNGSPVPKFDFDDARTYFRATLPVHPEYAAISAIQDAAYLRTVGSADDAFKRIDAAWSANESSSVLATEMIRLHASRGQLDEAEDVFARFANSGNRVALANVGNVLVEALITKGRVEDAQRLLQGLFETAAEQDAIDSAILARRLRDQRTAHQYFVQAGDAVQNDARALHEFAQTKIRLAEDAWRQKPPSWREVNRRLLVEARSLLERVLQMDAPSARHGCASRDLARTLNRLKVPGSEVETAFLRAIDLLPNEPRFVQELEAFRERQRNRQSASPSTRRNGRRGHRRGKR